MKKAFILLSLLPTMLLAQANEGGEAQHSRGSMAIEEELQLDSIIVTQDGVIQRARYLEYHPNGNMAKQLSMTLDSVGNWVELDHVEWTDDYPLKGSSMIEFGYDTLGVYGGIYMKVINDDISGSCTEYSGTNGQWSPSKRSSITLNERLLLQSKAYYKYDQAGNEQLNDSSSYTYDDQDRLVHEEFFIDVFHNGQIVGLSPTDYFYDEVDTPFGHGWQTTALSSSYKRVSISSDDHNYEYEVVYMKIDPQGEWLIQNEHTLSNYGDSLLVEVDIRYRDNAVNSGRKYEFKNVENDSTKFSTTLEYTCSTDSTQWTLARRIEEYYAVDVNEFGREDENHQTYVTMADEHGELHQGYDVFKWEYKYWTTPYTLNKEEYYDGEKVYDVTKTYYYHDPNTTAITDIQAQPNEGMQFDLYGRRLSSGQRGAFMIKDGRMVLIQNQ